METPNEIVVGSWKLKKYPKGSNLQFKAKVEVKEEIHQVMLDNLWNVQNTFQKVNSLNALAFYLSNLPRQSFSYYVVTRGRQLGIFSTWVQVVESINDIPVPLYKGFRNIHEALEFARKNIGINFYVDPQCRKDLQIVPHTQFSTQPSTSYSHAVERDNTNRLDF